MQQGKLVKATGRQLRIGQQVVLPGGQIGRIVDWFPYWVGYPRKRYTNVVVEFPPNDRRQQFNPNEVTPL